MSPTPNSHRSYGGSGNRPWLTDPLDADVAHYLKDAECPYEPGMKIGEGSMAKVYLGTHRRSGRQAAIKIPQGSPWAYQRFRVEIDAMDRLDHPHVMPLLEADPARRWYAMPWAEYSLRQLRRSDPYDLPALRKALSSIAGAMMHAHSNGCIHRDASPDNLLRLRNGHWVLSDFGIAQLRCTEHRGTETGEHFGTPDFSAPEVYANPATATATADAWSIGALASWFTSIRPGQIPNSEQGTSWLELIEATMQPDPANRWPMTVIATHLEALPAARPLILVKSGGVVNCARCGEDVGVDASGRCQRCGFIDEI